MKDYDTTVARIAGNILSSREDLVAELPINDTDDAAVMWAVAMAFRIVAVVKAQCQAEVDAMHKADLKKTRQYLDEQARVLKT